MTILQEAQVYGEGICKHCTGLGDAHKLHCQTLKLKPGWAERVPFEFSGDPFEAAWERRMLGSGS